ncbi:unnamed protein product [Merluccius merluccius]
MLRGIQLMGSTVLHSFQTGSKGCQGTPSKLSSGHLMPEEHKNKFVYLTVNFHGYHKEERDTEGTVVKQIFQTMAVDGVCPESFTLYNNAKFTVVAPDLLRANS